MTLIRGWGRGGEGASALALQLTKLDVNTRVDFVRTSTFD